MHRRNVLLGIGGALTVPLAALAQQQAVPVIGFLHSGSPGPFANLVAAFRTGLREAGYIPGQNVVINFRWAEGNYDLVPSLALDLVRRQVAVIIAGGGAQARAVKALTRTIPLVFVSGGDPFGGGPTERAVGNATGISLVAGDLTARRLGLLRELAPSTALVAVLLNTNNPDSANQLADLQQTARALGQAIHITKATSERDIDTAFASFADIRPDALFVAPDPFFYGGRNQIVRLAGRRRLPAVYPQSEYVLAGGLISYGASLAYGYHEAGIYAGRILDGAAPGELPIIQASRFELAINVKTAKRLDLTVPQSILAQASEVIE